MKSKLFAALKLAFSRFLLGALGIWCTLGPIVLMNASESASQELKVVLVLLLAPCYAIVLVICLRAKWDALRELASDTRLALCFMLAGLLLSEMTGIFLAAKHKLVPVYVYVGFLLTELAKPVRFIKACSEYLPAHSTSSNEPPSRTLSPNSSRRESCPFTSTDSLTRAPSIATGQRKAKEP